MEHTHVTPSCHAQQVHKVPDSEFENNLTRFDLPAGAVAYHQDGEMLAAACADGTIKIIQVADQRVRTSDAVQGFE